MTNVFEQVFESQKNHETNVKKFENYLVRKFNQTLRSQESQFKIKLLKDKMFTNKEKHNDLHWSKYYDDECMIHLQDKEFDYFSQKRKTEKASILWWKAHYMNVTS